MPSVHTLATFAVASALLTVLPGPSVFYIMARSLSQGYRAGIVSEAGITAGSTVQVIAAAAGLSALLASSLTWFAVVKYLGAAYLVALGIRTLLASRASRADQPQFQPQPLPGVCWQGFVVTVLNPKLAIFLLAFLPQFVEPARAPAWLQIAVLGTVLNLVGAAIDTCYIFLAGVLGTRLRRSTRFTLRTKLASGLVYITLGVFTAVTGHRPRTA